MASDEFALSCKVIDDALATIERELDEPCAPERREELCRESQRLTEAMLAILRRRGEGGSARMRPGPQTDPSAFVRL